MANYEQWMHAVDGVGLDVDGYDGDQCVDVVVSWAKALYPGIKWQTLIPPVPAARFLFSNANTKYFVPIKNDHANPKQLPQQGDILVFDSTPARNYTNKFDNPNGHTGVYDHGNSQSYTIVMQDGSNPGGKTFLQTQSWFYRPCIGWLRAVNQEKYYIAVKGDTVDGICERFGLSVANDYAAFRKLNPTMKDLNVLAIGQKVRVR